VAKILIVDDDPGVRTTLSMLLTELQHQVVQVSDGRHALRQLKEQPADLVITDILMPEVDGLELIRSIRKNFLNLKILAMSGGSARLNGTDTLQLAGVLGANAVIHKPFSIHEITQIIQNILDQAEPAGTKD
jgi:CheY-like chemotaxis protein